MTVRVIQGDIPFEIDRIRRDDTKVENEIFPHIARLEELQ